MSITGTQGFSLNAGSEVFRGPSCPEGCLPGQVISHSTSVNAGNGTGTLNGATYPFTGSASFGTLLIEAPSFTLPAPAGFGDVSFETLFGLTTDSFLVFAFSDLDPNPIRLAIAGSGRSTSHFNVREEPGRGTVYFTQRITYDFGPPAVVPEPGSLLLVGGGLAALWARRRRVRASRCTD